MENVVFLDRRTVPIPLPKPTFAHVWKEFDQTTPTQVFERLRNATIAITNKAPIRQTDLERLPDLRLIAVAATGYDCVDVAWCREHGVAVANIPGYAREGVAEHVFMLILALRRNLLRYAAAVREGCWPKSPQFAILDYPIHDLYASTLGLIGYGAIAAEVERRAKAFGMHILVADHRGAAARPGRTPFEEVLGRSDVISLHAPLTSETRHLVGALELRRMKPEALLINTARGALVDAAALADALRAGRLGGAGIDVLAEEPPKEGHPLLDPTVPNLIVTPHVAWSSRQALALLAERLLANIEAFVKGRPQNLVS